MVKLHNAFFKHFTICLLVLAGLLNIAFQMFEIELKGSVIVGALFLLTIPCLYAWWRVRKIKHKH